MKLRLSFTEHPASVGENYLEHLRHAVGFAGSMFAGGLAVFVHAFVPFLFTKTGSGIIASLNTRMIVNRHQLGTRASAQTAVARAGKRTRAA